MTKTVHSLADFRVANSIADALTEAAMIVDEGGDFRMLVLEYDNGAGDIRYGTLPDDAVGYFGMKREGWSVRYIIGNSKS